MRLFSLLPAILLANASLNARTWTNAEGKAIEADFVSDDGQTVTIKKADGQQFTFPISKLSAADQAYIADLHKPAPKETAPSAEAVIPQEWFPTLDFGIAEVDAGRRNGYAIHRWAMAEVLAKQSPKREDFEKALKPLLGGLHVLADLGLPKEALPDATCPLVITLGLDDEALQAVARKGAILASHPMYGMAALPKSLTPEKVEADRARMAAEACSTVLGPTLPQWFAESLPAYVSMIPLESGWPQCRRARLPLQRFLADLAAEKVALVTPALIDQMLARPDATLLPAAPQRKSSAVAPWALKQSGLPPAPAPEASAVSDGKAFQAAAMVTLYYLRHLHSDGKGGELKEALRAMVPAAVLWRDYMHQVAAAEAVWEVIKADPATVKLPDGSFRVPSVYTVPEQPKAAIAPAELAAARKAVNDKLLALLGPSPGATVVAALRKAGITDAIAENTGAAIASAAGMGGGSPAYVPIDLTPDYSKAASPRPHPPLSQRHWPMQINVSPSAAEPVLVSSDASSATFRVGKFQFETGPKVSPTLAKELARTFITMQQLVRELPWDLQPAPVKGDYFIAKLYESRSDYDRIAPPSSGGFYSLEEKMFHVPYQSLGIEKKGEVWTRTKLFNSDTLVHELTHMMMDRIVRHLPIWVTEGSAEYVATIPFTNGIMRTGDLPQALKSYAATMAAWPKTAGAAHQFAPSAKKMVEIMHMSERAWHEYAGTAPRVRPEFTVNKNGSRKPPVVQSLLPVDIAARQHELYMHACLLFYYFLHLDSQQRGDPMLVLFDKAIDLAPQWLLYEEAVDQFRLEAQKYDAAWRAFTELPGVQKLADGKLQYPATLTPPPNPILPRPPLDFSHMQDNDVGLALLSVLEKGRSNDQLEKSFRAAFAKLGITLQ